ncbi:hypothetical protein DL98DRAFT_652984 [Cadophora sp. DSE1049]|nr:hypothetical protein DL98DRAFT_652984 [Cadophora sp. DSE1049]
MSNFHESPPVSRSQSLPQTPLSSTSSTRALFTPWDKASSVTTPSIPVSPLTIPTTPTKLRLPVEDLEKPFGDYGTPTPAGLATRCEAYDKIVSSIVKLHPDEWLNEGQAAVYKEQFRTRKGAEVLQEKLVHAFEAASRAQMVYAEILLKFHSLDPDTYAFRVFKTWTLANILYNQPELSTQLKIEVSNKGYNPGYTKVCEWIDAVAEDPEGMLEDIAILCAQTDQYDLGDGINLRETLVAMAHHFENDHEELCRIYPEYKTVPMVPAEEERISTHGRVMRSRR